MRAPTIAAAAIALLTLSGCSPSPDAQLQANKELVRRFIAATNAADWEGLTPLVSEDLVRHSAATPGPTITSRDAFIQLQKSFLQSFPDQKVTVQQMIAEDDRVAVLATYSGTQTGPMGELPASGKRVEAPFLGILRIQDGRIAEMWVEWDNMAMLQQLGVTPPVSS